VSSLDTGQEITGKMKRIMMCRTNGRIKLFITANQCALDARLIFWPENQKPQNVAFIHLSSVNHLDCKRTRNRSLGCLFDPAGFLKHQKGYHHQVRDLLSSGTQCQCRVADYLGRWIDFAIGVPQGFTEPCDRMVFLLRRVELSFHNYEESQGDG